MNRNEQIDKLTNDAIGSIDTISRATPKPYLITRINERLNRSRLDIWEKAGWFIGRPAVAFTGLALLIVINIVAISYIGKTDAVNVIVEQALSDEFTITIATIYDNETP